jgi:ADP-heptose:LPS heptosyltransferase
MYTGGADERKNLHRLIQAYAGLPAHLRAGYQLVFVGKMPPGYIETFFRTAKTHGLDDNDLVVAGYVPDEDLVNLYNACDLFVFPSTHEGFGIPPLEAMSCRAPVIASNATSLPEVVGLADAMFDPTSVDAIRDKLEQALTDPSFRERLTEHGIAHSKTFTWARTADLALTALQRFGRTGTRRAATGVNIQSLSLFESIRKRILVIKLDHLGDFILAIPALARLKARYPHSDIDVVLASASVPIATSLHMFANIHAFDFFKPRSCDSASATERDTLALLGRIAPHYDIAIDLRRQADSRFLLARVNATTRVGYETFDPSIDDALQIVLGSHRDVAFQTTPLNETSISLQMMRLVDALPANHNDYVALPQLCQVSADSAASTTSTGIALFPKAGNDVKEWSRQNYLDLIRLLLAHPLVDAVHVYFTDDREAQAFGLTGHGKLHVHAGLAFYALSQSLATNVICIANNSFGAHLASYLGLAVIAIYGGHETVSEWAPVFPSAYVIHYPAPCSPCHIAHRSECPNDLLCLTEISVDTVYSALEDALLGIQANRAAGRPATSNLLTESKGSGALMTELFSSIAELGLGGMPAIERLRIAECAASNCPPAGRRLFVDVSYLVQRDAKSGIQRVVRSVFREMLACPPPGFSVVPVYATVDQLGYRRASRFTEGFLGRVASRDRRRHLSWPGPSPSDCLCAATVFPANAGARRARAIRCI